MFTGHMVPGKEGDIQDVEEGHRRQCGSGGGSNTKLCSVSWFGWLRWWATLRIKLPGFLHY